MINDELLESIKNFSSERQNLLKKVRASKIPNAQASSHESIILESIFNGLDDIAREIRKITSEITIAEASALGEIETVEKLVQKDKTLVNYWTTDGFTPLALACAFSGSIKICEILISNGAEINTVTKNKFIKVAPIHASMFGGHNDILELLLEKGANVNLDQENKTSFPLHEAVLRKDAKTLKLLLQYGAKKDNKIKNDKTALDLAVETNFKEGIDLLS